MKAKTKVQVRTLAGLVDAPCYHQWKQDVGGMEFEFALHVAAGHAKGFVAPLAISELSTGYDIKATITHPVSRAPLNSSNIQGLKAGQVKGVAHAALHNLLHKKIGAGRFLQAMLGAQMQLSKIDLSKYEASGTMTETYRNQALLDNLLGAKCKACDGTKVLTTTDKDHEGQPIEIACTECAPKAIELPETPVASMMWSGDMQSPTEEEWYEGLEPENKLEYLQQKLPQMIADSKALTARATKADYDRIDDMDSDIRDVEAKIKALTLDGLKLRLGPLQEQASQHGTMTGDTTDRDYEDLTDNIADIEQQIAELESKPCSN